MRISRGEGGGGAGIRADEETERREDRRHAWHYHASGSAGGEGIECSAHRMQREIDVDAVQT